MRLMKRYVVLAAVLAGFAPAAMADAHQMKMSHMSMAHMREAPQGCSDLTLNCATTVTPFFAADGTLWIAARAGNRIFVAHSQNDGRTFSNAVAIDSGSAKLDWGPDARPKIVVDRSGIVTVAYATFRDNAFDGEVFTTQSRDGGKSFDSPRPITDVQESQRFIDIRLDADGHLFAAWLDKRDRVAFKAEGKAYPGAGLAFAWSNDHGKSFSKTRIVLDNTCECCRLAVALKGPGQPVVLFRKIFPGGIRDPAIVTFHGPNKPGLLHRVSVDDWQIDACPHKGPSLAIAADGSYHAVWFTQGKARQGLFYARSTDAGKHFSKPLPLGPAGQALSRSSILATGKTIWIAWKAFDGTKTNLMLMTSHDDGASFGPLRVVSSTAKNSDHPILVRGGNKVFLSWQTQEGYHLIAVGDAS